jgi:hypothetical protein
LKLISTLTLERQSPLLKRRFEVWVGGFFILVYFFYATVCVEVRLCF